MFQVLFEKRSKQGRKRQSRATRTKFGSRVGTPDTILLFLTLFFLVLGLIMIFDASVYQADEVFSNRFHFVVQQLVWILLGLLSGAIFYSWDYRKFSKLAVPGMILTLVLLVAVLIFGDEINGSRRWFSIAGFPIQPAELAKPVMILYLCSWLSKERKSVKDFKLAFREHLINKLLPFVLVLGIVGGLVILEPDLGTAVVICAISSIIYFVSGNDLVHMMGTGLLVFVGGLLGAGAAVLETYRLERFRTYFELLFTGQVADPRGTGYQMQQILLGIGSGGFWGKGFGESRQRFGYLVENTAFTDSIFAIILEEMGMLGGFVLIVLFLFMLYRIYKVAINAPDKLGRLLAGGIGFWLVFQAFMHMGANVGLLPLTGVPLTFFTYGGSSTIVAMVGVGMLLNVSRYCGKT